jgi:hypothetical protein
MKKVVVVIILMGLFPMILAQIIKGFTPDDLHHTIQWVATVLAVGMIGLAPNMVKPKV